jgi:hypothetical protein
LDREYLQDYELREKEEYDRLVERRIQDGTFNFEKDRYPPDKRFINLQEPVALTTLHSANTKNLWAQIPFAGSLIISVPSYPKYMFEENLFPVSEIPEIIRFTKETGKLQFVLHDEPTCYAGLDYLDSFFKELKPPFYLAAPFSIFGNEKDIQRNSEVFNTLGSIRYYDFLRKQSEQVFSSSFKLIAQRTLSTYLILKLGHYDPIVEIIEKYMIDDPEKAFILFLVCQRFITVPINDLLCDSISLTLEDARTAEHLPSVYRPREVQFPVEIGKFLLKKLTYAAKGMRACYNLLDEYDSYDLKRVQKALNEGIVTNNPDIVAKSEEEFSMILDNIWEDKTITDRIKNIEIGVPVSIAAIGGIVAGLPGLFAGGLLSELGFKVMEKATEKYAEKLFSVKGEGLTERLAKLRTKSFQANIYDFKQKYKDRMVPDSSDKSESRKS